MQRRVVLCLALLLCLPAVAHATLTVNVGPHTLLANTPNQVVTLTVSDNASAVIGSFDMWNWIGNNTAGPIITNIDAILGAGYLFGTASAGGAKSGANVFGNRRSGYGVSSTGAGKTVAGNGGNLVQVTFDTTGVPAGTYSWSITANPSGASFFADTDPDDPQPIASNLVAGSLTIPGVPEPSSIVLGLFAAAGLGMIAVRKHRARRAA